MQVVTATIGFPADLGVGYVMRVIVASREWN